MLGVRCSMLGVSTSISSSSCSCSCSCSVRFAPSRERFLFGLPSTGLTQRRQAARVWKVNVRLTYLRLDESAPAENLRLLASTFGVQCSVFQADLWPPSSDLLGPR